MAHTPENKLTESERIFSPEDWEAFNELAAECVAKDIPFAFSYDTGRYQEEGSAVVTQGRQGFRLVVDHSSYKEGSEEKIYRSLKDLVKDGQRILGIIATEQHIEDTEIY